MNSRQFFLDHLYDAAVDPELWPGVLRAFADLAGGQDAVLRSYDVPTEQGLVVAGRHDVSALDANFRAFASHNPLKSPIDQLARSKWAPGYKRDIDWLPKEVFVRTAYYNDFYRKFDIHSDVSIGFECVDLNWTGVDIYRSEKQGPFSEDDLALCMSLQPHMARATRLTRGLADSRGLNDGLAAVIDRSPLACFLVDRTGRVRHSNAAGQRLIAKGGGLIARQDRLVCASYEATQRLHALIARAAHRVGGSMALAPADGPVRLAVEVVPLSPRHAWPFAAGPAAIVTVTDPAEGGELSGSMLRDLFDLTPAEVRVARALVAGLGPRGAAEHLGIGIPTVRSHLVHIYAKTGAAGQGDLCRLLGRLSRH